MSMGGNGVYYPNIDIIKIKPEFQVYALIHELLHDQQNAMHFFISNGMDVKTMFSSVKLCEAEVVAFNGTFSWNDINCVVLKE